MAWRPLRPLAVMETAVGVADPVYCCVVFPAWCRILLSYQKTYAHLCPNTQLRAHNQTVAYILD